ncbi:hypothetical protein [Asticcacaulis sp. AC402]|uniref:hypothetical protein n=1 Tax=Asticcacaulis sp. AC402 TaxID=1282361 RepID=UPI0003C3AF4E|nr:hypothetical protein [Asticcacaulis sp. AC402]ESQ73719.1 hypothetical protein ABAC402_17795 [Asticcacaulis sp. AC402]
MPNEKLFDGRAPLGRGWDVIAENDEWFVYAKKYDPSVEWRNVKLVAKTRRRKANYSIAQNGERWADNHDNGLLGKRDPDLHSWIEGLLLCY